MAKREEALNALTEALALATAQQSAAQAQIDGLILTATYAAPEEQPFLQQSIDNVRRTILEPVNMEIAGLKLQLLQWQSHIDLRTVPLLAILEEAPGVMRCKRLDRETGAIVHVHFLGARFIQYAMTLPKMVENLDDFGATFYVSQGDWQDTYPGEDYTSLFIPQIDCAAFKYPDGGGMSAFIQDPPPRCFPLLTTADNFYYTFEVDDFLSRGQSDNHYPALYINKKGHSISFCFQVSESIRSRSEDFEFAALKIIRGLADIDDVLESDVLYDFAYGVSYAAGSGIFSVFVNSSSISDLEIMNYYTMIVGPYRVMMRVGG